MVLNKGHNKQTNLQKAKTQNLLNLPIIIKTAIETSTASKYKNKQKKYMMKDEEGCYIL
jgi:hypothetical protein